MEELAKIVRVIARRPKRPHNTLLVLDATTGQNALNQVKVSPRDFRCFAGLVHDQAFDRTAIGGVSGGTCR